MNTKRFGVGLILIAQLIGSTAFPKGVLADTAYTMTDLGTLGGLSSEPGAINDAGQFIAWSSVRNSLQFHK